MPQRTTAEGTLETTNTMAEELEPIERKEGMLPDHLNKGVATHWKTRSATPAVPLKGIAGFHVVTEASGVRMASMKLDKDVSKSRVYTGHGDQPNNKGDSRFGTASVLSYDLKKK